MKLTKYNATNVPAAFRKGTNILRVTAEGVFAFSKALGETMDLAAGNKVAILQDEDNPNDWYICKDKDGFEVRPSKGTKQNGAFQFNNRSMARTFFDAFDYKGDSYSFEVAENSITENKVELWKIETDGFNHTEQ